VTITRLLCVAAAVLSTVAVHAQPATDLWLIHNTGGGEWSIQEGGQKLRVMDKYEVLTRSVRITCRKAPCTLLYLTETGETSAFPPPPFKPLKLAESFVVPAVVPAQAKPPAGRRAADFQEIIASVGVRGGRRKDSPTCFGELSLLAPACGETMNAESFTVRWPSGIEPGKLFTLMIGGADSSERRRWNVPADAGQFRSKAVEDYLASLQLPDRPTDVTVRLVRTENFSATRLVRLPSRAEDAELRKRLKAASLLPDLSRNLTLLENYLKMRMWSSAAEVAEQLLRDAPNSLEIRKYALIGLCHSGLADQITQVRNSLKDAGITGLCDDGAAP
jgi:hypothetical protein